VAKTVEQIKAWLDSPNRKCILADIGYYSTTEKTMYLSTLTYYDGNIEYLPIIVGGISFAESLSTDLTVSINYGTIELENTGGAYDSFLQYIWKRRNINLYIGDPSWPKSDFTLIFSGLVENLVSSGESSLQLTLVDKLESLNEAITTKTSKNLTGNYTIKNSPEEKLLPVLFGEVFNLSPMLVDNGINYDDGPWTGTIININNTVGINIGDSITATDSSGSDGAGVLYGGTPISCIVSNILDNNKIMYTVTGGTRPRPGNITNLTIAGIVYAPITGKGINISYVKGTGGPVYKITDGISSPYLDEIIEARDKAAPIEINTSRLSVGEFMLKYNLYGTITCSARSFPVADCTVPKIISHIVKNYGTNKLTDADLELNSISPDKLDYTVGIYVTERTNILEVCNELAKSINCGLYYSPITISNTGEVTSGKLRLVELKVPSTSVGAVELNDSLMLEGTLQITESFQVKPSIKLGYCKNYTTQQSQDLALALNPTHGNVYKDQYWYVEVKDSDIINLYSDTGEVKEELTHLLVTSEAQLEAMSRLDLWKIPRHLITATYLPHLIFTQLGDIVTIKSNRFGLSNGKPGLVYSISRDWITGFIEIGVLI
jgi:hypothetical protein